MLRPGPFPAVGAAVKGAPLAPPGDTAHGRYGGRMGPPPGGRIRITQSGLRIALRNAGLSQPPTRRNRVSEHERIARRAGHGLESRAVPFPEAGFASQRAANSAADPSETPCLEITS